MAAGLPVASPPVFLCGGGGALPGGPLVRGCLQIIREQIPKEGGKKALRRQTGSLSSGAECQRQESCNRGPAFAAREGRREGGEEGRRGGREVGGGEEGRRGGGDPPWALGREGTGWSVLD